MHSAVVKDPSIGFGLVLQLTGTNGSQRFDRITKTKTVESILASTDSSGIRDYISLLFGQVNQAEETDRFVYFPTNANALVYKTCSDSRSSTDTRRSWIIEQLAALLRHGSISKEDDWVLSIIHWFVAHGFFNVTKKSSKSKYHAVSKFAFCYREKLTDSIYSYASFQIHPLQNNSESFVEQGYTAV